MGFEVCNRFTAANKVNYTKQHCNDEPVATPVTLCRVFYAPLASFLEYFEFTVWLLQSNRNESSGLQFRTQRFCCLLDDLMNGGIIVVCIHALYMFDDGDSSTRSQLFYQIQFPLSLSTKRSFSYRNNRNIFFLMFS